jgi:hypothetical protein
VDNQFDSVTPKVQHVSESAIPDPATLESTPKITKPVPQIEKPKSIEVPQVPTRTEADSIAPDALPPTPELSESSLNDAQSQPSGPSQPEFASSSLSNLGTQSPAETTPHQQRSMVSPAANPPTNLETFDNLEPPKTAYQSPPPESANISAVSDRSQIVEDKSEGTLSETCASPEDHKAIPRTNDGLGEKSASEIAAEITGSLASKSSERFGDKIQNRDDLFSEAAVTDQNDSVSQYSSLIDKAQQVAKNYLGSEQQESVTTNFEISRSPLPNQSTAFDLPDNQPNLEPEQDVASAALNFSERSEPAIQHHNVIQDGDQETGSGLLEGPAEGVFNKLYENGTAQILEPAEVNISKIDAEINDLRIGKSDSQLLSEKLNQIQQNELDAEVTRKTPVPSITDNAVEATTGRADEPPFADITEAPLTTSIENSSMVTSGYESVPQTGNQPEDRPTATTVDLRMLKEQLAGKARTEADSRPLSEILGQNVHESDAPNLSIQEKVDTNITDLANSIRDICQKQDPIDD